MHRQLFTNQTGTTSYLIGVASQGLLTVAYEGDCACGMAGNDGNIEWFTPPHCQANWKRDRSHRELALDPARNLVTRSLRATRAPNPDFFYASRHRRELVLSSPQMGSGPSSLNRSKLLRSMSQLGTLLS